MRRSAPRRAAVAASAALALGSVLAGCKQNSPQVVSPSSGTARTNSPTSSSTSTSSAQDSLIAFDDRVTGHSIRWTVVPQGPDGTTYQRTVANKWEGSDGCRIQLDAVHQNVDRSKGERDWSFTELAGTFSAAHVRMPDGTAVPLRVDHIGIGTDAKPTRTMEFVAGMAPSGHDTSFAASRYLNDPNAVLEMTIVCRDASRVEAAKNASRLVIG